MPLTLSSTMTQISLISYPAGGQPELWGVDGSQKIYQYTGGSWKQIPGALVQVSAAPDGTVWGVNAAGLIYRYNGDNSWTQIPGGLVQVAVANKDWVSGVNAKGEVWRYLANGNTWTPLAGPMKKLSAYWSQNSGVWRLRGLNAEGHACEYQSDSNSWDVVPNDNTSGTVAQLDIAGDVELFALDSAGSTSIYRGGPDWWGKTALPNARYISAGRDGSISVIDSTGKTIVYDNKFLSVLDFRGQPQQRTNWCWAAGTTSVEHFYHTNSQWTQCQLATEEYARRGNQVQCCPPPPMPGAGGDLGNQGSWPDRPMDIVGLAYQRFGNALTTAETKVQMAQGRPIVVDIHWRQADGSLRPGHIVVIYGYQTVAGESRVVVYDPGNGGSVQNVSYEDFRQRYLGSGVWVNSYTTRP